MASPIFFRQRAELARAMINNPKVMILDEPFRGLDAIALLPMEMSAGLTAISFSLTTLMCVASALVAARRVIATDPAEVF